MQYTWKTRFGVTVACVGGFWVLAQITAQADANDATQPLSAVSSVVSGSSSEGTPPPSEDGQKGTPAGTEADGGDGTVTQTNTAEDTGGDASNQGINVGVQGLQCIGVKVSCDNDNTTGQAAIGGDGKVAQSNTSTGQTGGNAQATSGSSASGTEADGGDGTVTQTNTAEDTGGDASNKGINIGVQGLQCIGVKVSCDNDNTTGQAAIGGDGYVHQSNTSTGQTGGNATTTDKSGYPTKGHKPNTKGSNGADKGYEPKHRPGTSADGGDGTVTQTNTAEDTGGDASNKGINVGVQGLQCIGAFVHCDNDNTTGQAAIGGDGKVAQSNTSTGQTGGNATTTDKSGYPTKGHKPDTKGSNGTDKFGQDHNKGKDGKGHDSKTRYGSTHAEGGDGTVTQTNTAEDTGGDASNKGINIGVQGLQCIGLKVSCDNDNTTGQAAIGGDGYVHQSNTSTGQTGGNATAKGADVNPVWKPRHGDKAPRPTPGHGDKCEQRPQRGYTMKGAQGSKGICAPRPVKRPGGWKHAPVPA